MTVKMAEWPNNSVERGRPQAALVQKRSGRVLPLAPSVFFSQAK